MNRSVARSAIAQNNDHSNGNASSAALFFFNREAK